MDYTITNTAQLFDDLLSVLNKHYKEPGAIEALEYLKAAKLNYKHRSIDHMTNSLILTIHSLVMHPPSEELQSDLRTALNQFVKGIFEAGSKLAYLAHQYEETGGRLLTQEEILKEIDERRGLAR